MANKKSHLSRLYLETLRRMKCYLDETKTTLTPTHIQCLIEFIFFFYVSFCKSLDVRFSFFFLLWFDLILFIRLHDYLNRSLSVCGLCMYVCVCGTIEVCGTSVWHGSQEVSERNKKKVYCTFDKSQIFINSMSICVCVWLRVSFLSLSLSRPCSSTFHFISMVNASVSLSYVQCTIGFLVW